MIASVAKTAGRLLLVGWLVAVSHNASAATLRIDFEELPLDSADFYSGADLAGGFASQNAWFNNLYTPFTADCCWNGWAYSQTTDTVTAGVTNQYSAFVGGGATGSAKYGVAFNGFDAGGGIIPEITLPISAEPISVQVTNTTYAALSMLQGDAFAKVFGGPSGDEPDWFLLTVEGINAEDVVVGSVPFYLADYRFGNPADDFVLDQWTNLDLTPLAGLGVHKLAWRLTSSDNGLFGMNTPAYVAIDNLLLDVAVAPGDFDLDGAVDHLDLDIWSEDYGTPESASVTTGDADEDRDVDGLDLLLWQRHVTNSRPVSQAVPEPTTPVMSLGLLLFARAFGVRRRKHPLRSTRTIE